MMLIYINKKYFWIVLLCCSNNLSAHPIPFKTEPKLLDKWNYTYNINLECMITFYNNGTFKAWELYKQSNILVCFYGKWSCKDGIIKFHIINFETGYNWYCDVNIKIKNNNIYEGWSPMYGNIIYKRIK